MDIRTLAERTAGQLVDLCRDGKIGRVDIDIVRAVCEVLALERGLAPMAQLQLEEVTLRRVVEKVG